MLTPASATGSADREGDRDIEHQSNQEAKDFDRAMRAQAERRFDAAADLWGVYVERYPDQASGYANLALCLINCSRAREALDAARRAHALSPAQEGYHWVLLEALSANGLAEELERRAVEHTERYPDHVAGWSMRGRAALLKGEPVEAERCFRKAVDLDPCQNHPWAQLGQLYFQQGRYEEALDVWGKAQAHADTKPGPPERARFEALMGMGWSLLLMGKPDRALALAEQAEGLNVIPAEAQGLRARCLLAADRPGGIGVAEDAFRNGYSDAYLRARVAFEYASLGKPAEAEKHLGRMGASPRDAATSNLVATASAALGRTDEAVAELKGLEDDELEPHVRLNGLAIAHRLAGDYERAEEASLKALEIRRDEVVLTTLASQYVDRGRYGEAEPLLEEALRLAPDLPQARYELGFAYASNGKPARAKEHLRAVLASERANERQKARAADLLGRIGRNEEILSFYKEQGLVLVHHEEQQQREQRALRQDTLRYEEECGRLAATSGAKLRWTKVETGKKKTHFGRKKEVDVLGLVEGDGRRRVGVGECKLKTGSEVTHGEMRELVEKMALVLCEERHGAKRGVEGCFFSASGYDGDALELARKHQIRTFLAVPQKGWEKRADWKIGTFKEVP